MGGKHYNRRCAEAEMAASGGPMVPAWYAKAIIAELCLAGRHKTETTDEGDEECRFCGVVFDGADWSRVLRSSRLGTQADKYIP